MSTTLPDERARTHRTDRSDGVDAGMTASPGAAASGRAGALSADAFLSLGSMEGIYEPIVTTYAGDLSAEAFRSLGSMEGFFEPLPARVEAAATVARAPAGVWPGYGVAAIVAACAYIAHYLPIAPFTVTSASGARHPVSAAIIAVVAGVVLRNAFSLPDTIKVGCKRIVRKVIPLAIICMGAGLNLTHLAHVGGAALAITAGCIALAIVGSYYLARLCGLRSKTALLLGAGTGICGNSAIVAVAPLIEAEDDDVALSVGTVNLFGLLAMLVWPVVGGWLNLSDVGFGVWSGTSIHAVPQVVAAGFAYSPDAGALATLVKLVRVALLAPVVFILALLYARRRPEDKHGQGRLVVHYARFVPWFVWGFVLLAALNTLGLLPALRFEPVGVLSDVGSATGVSVAAMLKSAGKVLLTLALAAIGLEVNIRHLAGVGARAIVAGLSATVALGAVSLGLVMLLI
ncbi:MAG: YeiH family protein [Phycisphaerae bacterium]